MKSKFLHAHMKVAEIYAALSTATRAKVGAVIVKNNKIISVGYNGTPSGFDNVCEIDGKTRPEVIHAEMNALMGVAASHESTEDSVLFCTHSPCLDCAKHIVQAGIKKVVVKDHYISASRGGSEDFLKQCGVEILYLWTETNEESNIKLS